MIHRINIDETSCTTCGLCAEVCPNKIIVKTDENEMSFRNDRIDLCFTCGQCMAVCPSASIMVDGLSYEKDFFELPKVNDNDDFFKMIQTRRAVRNFRDNPVSRDLLEKIVEAISFAPPGFPPLKTEIIVVSDPGIMKKALPHMIDFYESMVASMRNPVIRYFIKKEVGKQRFKTMQDHMLPLMKSRIPELNKGVEDTITRHAPAMILFLADRNGEDISNDIFIASTYGMLAVHSLGLGGSIMDIIPPAIERSNELRNLFNIPGSSQVISSIIIGHPKYRYQRGIKRKLKDVRWM